MKIIKKILCSILCVILILNFLFLNVSAESLSFSTANELFESAFKTFVTLRFWGWPQHPEYSYGTWTRSGASENVSFKSSSDGKPYIYQDEYEYAKPIEMKDNPFQNGFTMSNVANLKAFISKSFTKEMMDTMLLIETYYGDTVELYRDDSDGNLRVLDDGTVEFVIKYIFENFRLSKSYENTAYATVTVWRWVSMVPNDVETPLGKFFAEEPGYLPSTETVEFTKTADGWRVSGGTAFEVMLGDREPNPNTGDPSAIAIPALTAAAVISLALPVGIMRRRRRYA